MLTVLSIASQIRLDGSAPCMSCMTNDNKFVLICTSFCTALTALWMHTLGRCTSTPTKPSAFVSRSDNSNSGLFLAHRSTLDMMGPLWLQFASVEVSVLSRVSLCALILIFKSFCNLFLVQNTGQLKTRLLSPRAFSRLIEVFVDKV